MHRLIIIVTTALLLAAPFGTAFAAERPNVIVVITDDQGYGDVGAHGNEMIQTPNLDRLYSQSVRLTDYHVDPTCSPTRSALMTGKYSTKTGVWHTIMGRSILFDDQVTAADIFKNVGYRTAMFGKWHLGDNYPQRPEDTGFEHVLRHGGGGVGQTPDYFGNDYFDDTYWLNEETKKFEGYCTDVWFDGALEFIEKQKAGDQPFFVYLSTNAPHGPFNVDDKYAKPYRDKGVPDTMAKFYGMITNIDENMGRLMKKLDEWKIADNTILIFTTDNGTAAGAGRGRQGEKWTGFNAGMRGNKGSEYDGGHRVPFFVRFPNGNLAHGQDVHRLTAHIDVLPTLIELCNLEQEEPFPAMDGRSFASLLRDPRADWADRAVLVHSQRIEHPQKWRKAAVMTERWRLINGKELYNIISDPGQQDDVAAKHPQVVKQLTGEYEKWWADLSKVFDRYARIHFGNAAENPARLTCHDWHTNNKAVPWHQNHIQRGLNANGYWSVHVDHPGTYRFTLRRWDTNVDKPIEATEARLKIGDHEVKSTLPAGAREARFDVKLKPGPAMLQTWLSKGGQSRGAYYVYVERLKSAE